MSKQGPTRTEVDEERSWLKWPRNRKEWAYRILTVVIPLAGLLAAVLAIPQVSDHFKSPQEKLAGLGYAYNEPALWSAIQNKHIDAVEHFHDAGMTLEVSRLSRLLEDEVFSKPLAQYLVSSKMLDTRHCPTAVDQLAIYNAYTHHADKSDVIRSLCGVPEVRNALLANLKELKAHHRTAVSFNSDLTQRTRSCVSKYLSEDEAEFVTQAATASLTGSGTLTERECVLGRVRIKLLEPSLGDPDFRDWVSEAANECCATYVEQRSEDTSEVEAVELALKSLGV